MKTTEKEYVAPIDRWYGWLIVIGLYALGGYCAYFLLTEFSTIFGG